MSEREGEVWYRIARTDKEKMYQDSLQATGPYAYWRTQGTSAEFALQRDAAWAGGGGVCVKGAGMLDKGVSS